MGHTIAAGKEAAMKALGAKFAEGTWNKAANIWKNIWPELDKKSEVAKAIQEVSEKSNDPRVEAMLSWQLEKLDLPSEALDQIKTLLDQEGSKAQIITADFGGIAVGGNVQGSTITAGYHGYEKPE